MDSPLGRFPSCGTAQGLLRGRSCEHPIPSPSTLTQQIPAQGGRQAHRAPHHFHPGASNRNELPLRHKVLNLRVEPGVPAPHPLELLRLPEHRGQPQLPPQTSLLLQLRRMLPVTPHRLILSYAGEATSHKQQESSQQELAHLGAGEGELRVALHQTDHRDPAPSALTDGLLIRPQPGCRDRHIPPWLLLGTSSSVLPFMPQLGKMLEPNAVLCLSK